MSSFDPIYGDDDLGGPWAGSATDLLYPRGPGGGVDPLWGGIGGGAGSGGDFDLRSGDLADKLVSEVGVGNSFRREQRERYPGGAPLAAMSNLVHATEEELLLATPERVRWAGAAGGGCRLPGGRGRHLAV